MNIGINKQHTKERFDSFYKWSDEAIDKEFNTALWKHINISEMTAIFKLLSRLDNSKTLALDAGCGSGRILFDLKKRYINIIGCDFSMGLLKKAKEIGEGNVCLIQSDVERLPFRDESFDMVLSIRVIQHLRPDEQLGVIKEMARVLKKGGRLVLMTYNSMTLLCIYKNMSMSRLYKFWPHWPLKEWKWVVDDYCFPWELKRMFESAGLRTKNISGAVFGEPEILKSLKIAHLLEKYLGFIFAAYLKLCRFIDSTINHIWPFKYFLGRILIEGEKR